MAGGQFGWQHLPGDHTRAHTRSATSATIATPVHRPSSVDDTVDPNIMCPPDTTIECDESTDPNNTGWPDCSDNCGLDPNSPWHHDDPDPNNLTDCCGTGWFIRTWTCRDVCGNIATCQQKITLVDTTPPDANCPADLTVQCPGDEPDPATNCASSVRKAGRRRTTVVIRTS